MDKKLIAGIIAGVAVLVAAVLIIFSVSGKIDLNLTKGDKKDNSSVTSSQNDVKKKKTKSEDKDSSNSKSTETADEKDTDDNSDGVADVKVKKGTKSISVPIYVNNNDGMCAAKICVEFDTEHFDYADATKGTMFGSVAGNFADGKAYIVVYADDNSDVKGSGVAANLVLVPKKGTKTGTYKVTVNQSESEYANINEQFVNPDVQTGNIVIK